MAGTLLGSGKYTYEPAEGWGKLPDGWRYVEVAGVDVDSQDNVYLITRGEHPVIVFDREGNFLRSWGEGLFSRRTHAIHIGPDGSVYCTDDGDHTIRKFTPEGKLLLTIGDPNQPSKRFSGKPSRGAVAIHQRHLRRRWLRQLAGTQVLARWPTALLLG